MDAFTDPRSCPGDFELCKNCRNVFRTDTDCMLCEDDIAAQTIQRNPHQNIYKGINLNQCLSHHFRNIEGAKKRESNIL